MKDSTEQLAVVLENPLIREVRRTRAQRKSCLGGILFILGLVGTFTADINTIWNSLSLLAVIFGVVSVSDSRSELRLLELYEYMAEQRD